jgi:transcriptional regulator with XRE-family HTH domain
MTRPTDPGPPEADAFRERVRYLLDYRWRGSQREMARAIGVSQGLISKFLNGVQGPGRRLFAALASHPGISPDWLRTGAGQPLPLPEQGSLPIASGVLPGPPLEFPHLLTESRHPVGDALARPTRYWLPLPATAPLVRVPDYRLMVGDLLLMEGDRSWTRRPDLTDGRLCGARVSGGPEITYQLGWLEPTRSGLTLHLGAIPDSPPAPALPTTGSEHAAAESRNPVRRRRTIRIPKTEEQRAESRRAARNVEPPPRNIVTCDRGDVVAVCVYLARPHPVFGAPS